MGFLTDLRDFADYAEKSGRTVRTAAISVTERYARRVLRLKKSAPLEFRGIALRATGSKRWRSQHQGGG
jgi:hypothetical protein